MDKKVFIIEYVQENQTQNTNIVQTQSILKSIFEAMELKGEVVFYNPDEEENLERYLKQNALHVISRINTEDLKQLDSYFDFLRRLSCQKIEVSTHPDTLINLDFKDILIKLKDTPLGDKSTCFYSDFEDFTQGFPPILREEKVRILKKNYGTSGKNIFLVHFNDDQTVDCTEAKDNVKIKFTSIYEFLKFFETKFNENCKSKLYGEIKNGFVSCKYFPRIKEGEKRMLFVRDRVVAIVNKMPKKDHFSANLSAGAKYQYESPAQEQHRDMVEFALDNLDYLEEYCVNKKFPLLWTMDYVLDTDIKGYDNYILSEINCSCVDISTVLQYSKDIAKALQYE